MELLKAANVAKSYQGRVILADVSATLRAGTVTLFSAPSGSGKSTLLEILAGVQDPDGGSVTRNAPASLMFQDNALVPNLDAAGNLAYILPRGTPDGERRERIGRWLGIFGLEGPMYPRSMSSGMKRRLSLARTFLAERPITLLDEPFAFLDDKWHETVASLIRGKADAGGAVALAGHGAAPALTDACGDVLRVLELGPSPVTLPETE
ncbi:MAG: ATP-binding cassette domain-containing protein [Deltaproteobacteria bacterium]|nr:ATP-binding cassette domain-containing protein [Deltaproteobacteria bacterium]